MSKWSPYPTWAGEKLAANKSVSRFYILLRHLSIIFIFFFYCSGRDFSGLNKRLISCLFFFSVFISCFFFFISAVDSVAHVTNNQNIRSKHKRLRKYMWLNTHAHIRMGKYRNRNACTKTQNQMHKYSQTHVNQPQKKTKKDSVWFSESKQNCNLLIIMDEYHYPCCIYQKVSPRVFFHFYFCLLQKKKKENIGKKNYLVRLICRSYELFILI